VKMNEKPSISRVGLHKECIAIDLDCVYDGDGWKVGVICEETSPAGEFSSLLK